MSQVAKTRILWLMGSDSVSQAGCAALTVGAASRANPGLLAVQAIAELRSAWTAEGDRPYANLDGAKPRPHTICLLHDLLIVRVFRGVGWRTPLARDDGHRLLEPRR